MKNILLLLAVLTIASCSKDDEVQTNSVQFDLFIEYDDTKLKLQEEVTVYLFNDINYLNGYDIAYNGKLINETGGPDINYNQKKVTSTGTVTFPKLKRGSTYTVVVDASNTFRADFEGSSVRGMVVILNSEPNLPGAEFEISFDISPYSSSTIYR